MGRRLAFLVGEAAVAGLLLSAIVAAILCP